MFSFINIFNTLMGLGCIGLVIAIRQVDKDSKNARRKWHSTDIRRYSRPRTRRLSGNRRH